MNNIYNLTKSHIVFLIHKRSSLLVLGAWAISVILHYQLAGYDPSRSASIMNFLVFSGVYIGAILTVAITAGLLHDEIHLGTIVFSMTRPVTRTQFLLGKLLGALVFVLVYEALVLFTGYLLSLRSSSSTLSLRVLIQALIANVLVVVAVEAFTALMAVLFVNSYAAGAAAVFYFYVVPASYSRLIQAEALSPFRNYAFWLEYLYPFGSGFERLLEELSTPSIGYWDLVYATVRPAIYASFFVWLSLRVFRRKNLF